MPKRNPMKLPRQKYKPGDIIEMVDNPGKYYEVMRVNTWHPDLKSWSYYCDPRYQPDSTDNYPVQRVQYECWTRPVKGQMNMFGKNRQARLELFKKMGEVAQTKTALNWALDRNKSADVKITPQTVKGEAVRYVREIFAEYQFPNSPQFSFAGMKRAEQARAGELNEAIVTVEGRVHAANGANITFYVPVMVREGKLLEPSLFFRDYNDGMGVPAVIGQSAINDLVRDNSTYGHQPGREMYSPPGSGNKQTPYQPRRSPGMFSTASAKTALRTFLRTGGAKTAQLSAEQVAKELIEEYGYDGARQVASDGLSNAPDSDVADFWLGVVDLFTEKMPAAHDGMGRVSQMAPPPKPLVCKGCGQPYKRGSPGFDFTPYCSRECRQQSSYGSRLRGAAKDSSWTHSATNLMGQPVYRSSKHPDLSIIPYHLDMGEDINTYDGGWQLWDRKNCEEYMFDSLEEAIEYADGLGRLPTGQDSEGNNITPSDYTSFDRNTTLKAHKATKEDEAQGEIDTQDRDLPKKVMPGARVRVKRKLQGPTRGGGRVTISAGTVGTVIRDMAGDGQQLYVEFDDGNKAVIKAEHLSGSSSKKKEAQMEQEAGPLKTLTRAVPVALSLMGPAKGLAQPMQEPPNPVRVEDLQEMMKDAPDPKAKTEWQSPEFQQKMEKMRQQREREMTLRQMEQESEARQRQGTKRNPQ